RRFEMMTMDEAAESYASGPTRVQLQNKDPRGWREFRSMLAEHSPRGATLTLRGVQRERPSLFDLTAQMKLLSVPAFVMAGDEDDPCLEASLLMKRKIPSSALAILPRTGHALNLEEPALFNMLIEQFFHQVESGRWNSRDPRSLGSRIL